MIYIQCQKNSKILWEGLTNVVILRGVEFLVKSSMESTTVSVLNQKYIWHLDCIKHGFNTRGIPQPNLELTKWRCPQCIPW